MDKNTKPEVKPGDWITICTGMGRDAVVCFVYEDAIEAVYLDMDRAISEMMIWNKNGWQFEKEEPCGGYADNSSRLREFVEILRGGRYNR